MSDQRDGGIAWCDETWNPIRGCSRVSPGCEHCYAEAMASRFCGPGQAYEGLARRTPRGLPQWTGEVRMVAEHLADPLRWRRPRRVFVNSMSDLFHEKLTNEQIAAVFGVMAAAPQHTFQVLTKRPGRMVEWFAWVQSEPALGCGAVDMCEAEAEERVQGMCHINMPSQVAWPLPNVWIGVTAEDQQRADERIPLLMVTPVAVRFVSVEPQLGPVDLDWCLRRTAAGNDHRIDWVITGAESGPGARPYDLAWARALRDQCDVAGVAFFLKQTIVGGKKVSTPALDGVVHAEFPGTAGISIRTSGS